VDEERRHFSYLHNMKKFANLTNRSNKKHDDASAYVSPVCVSLAGSSEDAHFVDCVQILPARALRTIGCVAFVTLAFHVCSCRDFARNQATAMRAVWRRWAAGGGWRAPAVVVVVATRSLPSPSPSPPPVAVCCRCCHVHFARCNARISSHYVAIDCLTRIPHCAADYGLIFRVCSYSGLLQDEVRRTRALGRTFAGLSPLLRRQAQLYALLMESGAQFRSALLDHGACRTRRAVDAENWLNLSDSYAQALCGWHRVCGVVVTLNDCPLPTAHHPLSPLTSISPHNAFPAPHHHLLCAVATFSLVYRSGPFIAR